MQLLKQLKSMAFSRTETSMEHKQKPIQDKHIASYEFERERGSSTLINEDSKTMKPTEYPHLEANQR